MRSLVSIEGGVVGGFFVVLKREGAHRVHQYPAHRRRAVKQALFLVDDFVLGGVVVTVNIGVALGQAVRG